MDLSVIIVSYNTVDLIGACLSSLESAFSGKKEIIVVDNASTDRSADFIRHHFPTVTLIRNSENRGFAAANNQGLSLARGKYIFFLNPDTVVASEALDKAVSFMDANLHVGLAGGRIVNPDGSPQESVSHRYPGATYSSGELEGLPGTVACVLGAAMIAPRECLESVRGFDEDFFLYGEDQDLCLRIRRKGYEIGFAEDAVIIHVSGQSERQTTLEDLWRKKTRAEYLFYRKHYSSTTVRRILHAEFLRTRFRLFTLELIGHFLGLNPNDREKLAKYRAIAEVIRKEKQQIIRTDIAHTRADVEPNQSTKEIERQEIPALAGPAVETMSLHKGQALSQQPKVSVILTAWQRPQYLEEQVARVLSQTIVPWEIILWYNKPPLHSERKGAKQLIHFKNDNHVKKIICDHNFGIIPRFSLASCMESEYVCIFDDDTMPGTRWLENCLNYVDTEKALCGTIGIRYLSRSELKTQKPRMGWEGMNEELEFVDLVGHSWFFRREWAKFFWSFEPFSREFGEDIHFCAMLQRHGIRVACPPHPKDNPELWGSVKPERGIDKVAISCSSDKSMLYWQVVKYELENGYKPVLL